MKTAVLHEWRGTPRYEDFPDQPVGADERAIKVKAVSLENIDRAMARGTHYGTKQFFPQLPAIIGFDGIGETDEGELIVLFGIKPPYGAMRKRW